MDLQTRKTNLIAELGTLALQELDIRDKRLQVIGAIKLIDEQMKEERECQAKPDQSQEQKAQPTSDSSQTTPLTE